jgi:two-component system, chemotaxis family, chemotaxis protein CheY
MRMQPSVLIVEDADTCASVLEIIFSSIPALNVITTPNADRAWALLENEPDGIRAIVTDVHMPGMDGLEFIARVRSHKLHRGVPIIVITGSTDPNMPEQARARGANAVFMKPYSPARVREKLEELLSDDIQVK